MITRLKRWFPCLMLLVFGLSACGLEGGAVAPPTVAPPEAPPPTTVSAQPTAEPPAVQTWNLGVTEEPLDLYPYSYTARTALPLIELLYPAPLQVVDEVYTTTGVLERVPSFANGDVAYVTTTVYLDTTGAITQTQTDVVSSVAQLTVTYRWNKNLRWSDGTPVTAPDSVFAYQLLRGSSTTAQLAIQSDLTADYVALDDHTTKAYLPPQRDDPNYLNTVWTPLPSHLFDDSATVESVSDLLGRQPLGYGLYRLDAWIEGTQLNFVRSDAALHADVPERLTVRLYPDVATLHDDVVQGSVDVGWTEQLPEAITATLQANVQNKTLALWTIETPIWEHIDLNLAVGALQDIRMRRALAHGFNRDQLSATLYGSAVAVWHSWIAPDSWAYGGAAITRYEYDPNQARALLDEINYKDTDGDGMRENPAGEPFALSLITSEQTAIRSAISSAFITDMAQIGLRINLETLPTNQLYGQQGPLFQRKFELALFGWLRTVEPNGAVLWSCAAIPNKINGYTGDNFTGWCIDTADAAIRTANSTLDQAIRAAAYSEHQAVFTRELPIIPVLARQMTVLAGPTIRGLHPSTFAPPTWNLAAWSR